MGGDQTWNAIAFMMHPNNPDTVTIVIGSSDRAIDDILDSPVILPNGRDRIALRVIAESVRKYCPFFN